MNLTELKNTPVSELVQLGESMGLENLAQAHKKDIIFAILKAHAKGGEDIFGDGVLEILTDGFGFLRSADGSYLAGPDDIYVSRARSAVSTCVPAIPSPARSGRRKRANVTSRCSRSTRSTTTVRKTPATRSCLKTSPRCTPTSVCAWSVATVPPKTSPPACWIWLPDR